MGRVADTQQARPAPLRQPVDLDRKKLYLLPTRQFLDAALQARSNASDGLAKRIQPLFLELRERTLLNDEPGLKIVAAVDQDQSFSIVDVAHHLLHRIPVITADS